MTLQTVNPFLWPGMSMYFLGNPAFTTGATLDTSSADYEAVVFSAPSDMTISHLGMLARTIVGSGAGTLGVEGVGATGFPDGTYLGASAQGFVATGALTTNTWFTPAALGATVSLTKGQMAAVTLRYASGTSLQMARVQNSSASHGVPYFPFNTGAGDNKGSGTGIHGLFIGTSATAAVPIEMCWPISSITTSTTFNNTNSRARGVRFQVPFKCRCVGLAAPMSNSTGDYNIILMDDSGSELSSSSTAHDGDQQLNLAAGVNRVYFDNAVTLSPATWYRAVFEPSSATVCSLHFTTSADAGYLSGMPGGVNYYLADRTSGSWAADDNTSVPLMDIIIDQLDDGVSSSSKNPYSSILQPGQV